MYAQLMASCKINLLTWFWDYTNLLTQRYLDQTNLEMCDHKIPAFCINNHRCYKYCINSSPLCSGMCWYSLAGLNPWTTKLHLTMYVIYSKPDGIWCKETWRLTVGAHTWIFAWWTQQLSAVMSSLSLGHVWFLQNSLISLASLHKRINTYYTL